MHQSVAESEYLLISAHTMHLFSEVALEKSEKCIYDMIGGSNKNST